MTEPLIPASVKLAAKRAFVRTTAQAYAATLATGISATVVLGIVTGTVDLVPTLVTIGISLASPFIAGAAAYASIIGKNGVPDEYANAGINQHVERNAG